MHIICSCVFTLVYTDICDQIYKKHSKSHIWQVTLFITNPVNDILMSYASATAKSLLVCFSYGWFLRHVIRTWVPGWLQMALVAVHKQKLGCKPPYDCYLMLSIDLATFCGIWATNGPLLGPFCSVSYWRVFSLPLCGSPPPPTNHPIEITCGIGEKTI